MATGERPDDGEGANPGRLRPSGVPQRHSAVPGPHLRPGPDVRPDADWEDILSLRVENRPADDAAKPRVRLSSLRPPAPPGGTPQEQIATAPRPAPPPPLRPGERWEPAELPPSGRQAEREREALRRLSESEEARRSAEARVADLERELVDLRARMAYEHDAARQVISGGTNGRELHRLRAELAAAREIIRAIEEAYLAGEGPARGGYPR